MVSKTAMIMVNMKVAMQIEEKSTLEAFFSPV